MLAECDTNTFRKIVNYDQEERNILYLPMGDAILNKFVRRE